MSSRALIVIVAADGSIQSLNRHCCLAIGRAAAEVSGRAAWEVLPAPGYAGVLEVGILRAAGGAAEADYEGSWRGADGGVFPVRWSCLGLRDEDGAIRHVVVSGVDLREIFRIQAELDEAVQRRQAILDTAVDGILTIGGDGLVRSFNRAAEQIFGYGAAEVLGRNVSMLMPQPYRSEHDGYLRSYLGTRRRKVIGIGREVEGLRKDGSVFPMELSVGELRLGGQPLFTGVVRDISARKRAEQEARQRQNELAHLTRLHSMGDLAAGLAHEINQPLTAILTYAQACVRMIQAGSAEPVLLHELAERIAHQGERAAEVVRRLRKYVEKGEMERQPTDLAESMREVLVLLQHELQVHGVRVSLSLGTDLPPLLLDHIQIEQVLVNLLRNAVDAMRGAGVSRPELKLSAAVSQAPVGVRLSVRDNGPGFGGREPEQLFSPFFTTKKEGLGQGLSICRRIVDAHGGRIWAETAPVGGAEFHIWLPWPDGHPPPV